MLITVEANYRIAIRVSRISVAIRCQVECAESADDDPLEIYLLCLRAMRGLPCMLFSSFHWSRIEGRIELNVTKKVVEVLKRRQTRVSIASCRFWSQTYTMLSMPNTLL